MLKRRLLLILLSFGIITACSSKVNNFSSGEGLYINQGSIEGFFYLYPNTDNPNLFFFNLESNQPQQLTTASQEIYDYEVSSDKNFLFYSILNSEGGTKIRKLNLATLDDEVLIDCGNDFCFNPVYSPKNGILLVNKMDSSIFSGFENELTQLWKYDLETAEFHPFSGENIFYGVFPKFNDQETYVAVQILDSKKIVIFNPKGESLTELESDFLTGVYDWRAGSGELYFLNEEINDDKPVNYLWHFNISEYTFLQEKIEGNIDDFLITNISFSPDGTQWIAGIKESVFLPSQVLWVLNARDNTVQTVIGDSSKVHANFQWNSAGNQILFQNFQLYSEQSGTSVVVWDLLSAKEVVIIPDAWFPRWLP